MAKIYLKTQALLFSLALLSGCTSHIMNGKTYNQISVGMSAAEACVIVGKPYRIKQLSGCQQYDYIERFDIGPQTTTQNTYVLVIKDGIIIDKYKHNTTPSVNFSTSK